MSNYKAITPNNEESILQPVDWGTFPGHPIKIDCAIELANQQIAFFQRTLWHVEDNKFVQWAQLIEHYLKGSRLNVLWALIQEPNPDRNNLVHLANGWVIQANFGGHNLMRAKDLYRDWENMLHLALGVPDYSHKFKDRPAPPHHPHKFPVPWLGNWGDGLMGTDLDMAYIYFVRKKPIAIFCDFKYGTAQPNTAQKLLYDRVKGALETAGVECHCLVAHHTVPSHQPLTAQNLMIEDQTLEEVIENVLSTARNKRRS